MLSHSDNNQTDVFTSTSRYLDNLLNTDKPYCEQMVSEIYPTELQLNKANSLILFIIYVCLFVHLCILMYILYCQSIKKVKHIHCIYSIFLSYSDNQVTVSDSKLSAMIGYMRTRVRKQPIIALYFESEIELKFYNYNKSSNTICNHVPCTGSFVRNIICYYYYIVLLSMIN